MLAILPMSSIQHSQLYCTILGFLLLFLRVFYSERHLPSNWEVLNLTHCNLNVGIIIISYLISKDSLTKECRPLLLHPPNKKQVFVSFVFSKLKNYPSYVQIK